MDWGSVTKAAIAVSLSTVFIFLVEMQMNICHSKYIVDEFIVIVLVEHCYCPFALVLFAYCRYGRAPECEIKLNCSLCFQMRA